MLNPPHPARRFGFSLIESAIVLGIIGLVIGGIWVAASSIGSKQQINDAMAVLVLAHDEADRFKKNVGTSAHDLAKIVALRKLPGNYKHYTNNLLSNGRQYISLILTTQSGIPLISGYVSLNVINYFFGPYKTKPDLCLALSNHMMEANLGTPVTPYHSLEWFDASDNSLGTWDYGTAKPDFPTLSSYCASATYFTFRWYL